MPDYRSDPMPSQEGRGIARKAWEAYARKVNAVALPLLEPAIDSASKRIAASMVEDLMGFWLAWHLCGGFEGEDSNIGRPTGHHRTSVQR